MCRSGSQIVGKNNGNRVACSSAFSNFARYRYRSSSARKNCGEAATGAEGAVGRLGKATPEAFQMVATALKVRHRR